MPRNVLEAALLRKVFIYLLQMRVDQQLPKESIAIANEGGPKVQTSVSRFGFVNTKNVPASWRALLLKIILRFADDVRFASSGLVLEATLRKPN
jgi:hypothetical protein